MLLANLFSALVSVFVILLMARGRPMASALTEVGWYVGFAGAGVAVMTGVIDPGWLGLGRLETESGQVGGVLEKTTPLLGPLAEGGVDETLTDDGVTVAEGGGQVGDVFEADLAAVDPGGCTRKRTAECRSREIPPA